MELGFTEKELRDGGIFVILVGPPGSGKTAFAKNTKEKYKNFEIISPDEIREELTGDICNQERNEEVFEKTYSRIAIFLSEGCNVIYDATNCRAIYRSKIIGFVNKNSSKIVCVVFDTPITKCLSQNKKRDRQVPEHIIENMHTLLRKHPPTIAEGYDVIFMSEVLYE